MLELVISLALASTHYYHLDRLGSVQMVTDQSGTVVESNVHQPYGTALAYAPDGSRLLLPTSDFGFTGHRSVDASGLIYMNVRYYDPALGLFISHDPARQFPNPYSYGDGDPLAGRDPSGAIFLDFLGASGEGEVDGLARGESPETSSTTSTRTTLDGRFGLPPALVEILRDVWAGTVHGTCSDQGCSYGAEAGGEAVFNENGEVEFHPWQPYMKPVRGGWIPTLDVPLIRPRGRPIATFHSHQLKGADVADRAGPSPGDLAWATTDADRMGFHLLVDYWGVWFLGRGPDPEVRFIGRHEQVFGNLR